MISNIRYGQHNNSKKNAGCRSWLQKLNGHQFLRLLFYSACLVSASATKSFSQQAQYSDLDNLAGKLIRSLRAEASESIFIHTDKSIYSAGETIWLNAYLVNKISHKISHQSRILFIDLVNENDSVLKKILLDPKSLRLDAGIALSPSTKDGNYWLRGYTQHILNSDSSEICVYPIYIVNPQNSSSNEVAQPESKTNQGSVPKVEFFPEGGALIAGANSVVGIRVTDQNNQPLSVSGTINDNRDSLTTTFQTLMAGTGKFMLFPWKTRKYVATIKTSDGKKYEFALPTVNDNNSAALSVVSEDDKIWKIRVSLGDSLYDKKITTNILGISRDSLCFAGVGRGMYETDVPKKNFPQGQATLLLFDEQERLLSERSIYNDVSSTIVTMHADKINYAAREKAVLDFTITGSDGTGLLSLFSVSVTDSNSVNYFYDEDLDAIQKKTYSPAERDLMMLVQKNKYRKWQLTDSAMLEHNVVMDDRFFTTPGRVVDRKGQALPGLVITAFATQENSIFVTAISDPQGRFQLQMPGAAEGINYMMQAADKNGKAVDAQIILDSILMPGFVTPNFLKKELPKDASVEIMKKEAAKPDFLLPAIGKEMKEVIVKTKIKKPVSYDEKKRVSLFSRVITSEMIGEGGSGTVANSVLMAGLHFRGGKLIVSGGSTEPLLVVNGIAMDSTVLGRGGGLEGASPLMSYLNSISPRDIDFIEVLSGPESANYGMLGANGVVIINTLSQPRRIAPGKQTTKIKFSPLEYTNAVSFTEPDYSKKETRKNGVPDQRSTIFWSGPVITDTAGKASIQFYTADSATTYVVTVKGITAGGDIFLQRFQVGRKL